MRAAPQVDLADGDGFFRGVNMRLDPAQLQEGWVSEARNKRFEDGVAKPRKGIRKMIWTNLEGAGNPPYPQPFGTVYGAGTFQDPDGAAWLIVVGKDPAGVSKVWRCEAGSGAGEVVIPPGTEFTGRVNLLQCFNVLLLQRGPDEPTLVCDDLDVGFTPIADPTLGVGEVKIPDSSNAIFFANRVFIPYERDLVFPSNIQDYTKGLSTITSFRVNQGSEDELVALFKFNDTTLIAAKERSIYTISNVFGTNSQIASDAILDSVTTEYGCKAAKSLVQVGSDVWFLADRRGVCSIRQTEQNKLQAVDIPVSRDIEPLVARIDWEHATNGTAAFLGNRFYLAVPIDSPRKVGRSKISAPYVYDLSGEATPVSLDVGSWYYWVKGANDTGLENGNETLTLTGYFRAQVETPTLTGTASAAGTADVKFAWVGYNNAVLVYDTLQQAWAGYDTGDAVDVVDWVKVPYAGSTRLAFFDSVGFLNLYEDGFFDDVGVYGGVLWTLESQSIQDYLRLRGYLCGDPQEKRFMGARFNASTWWPEYNVSVAFDGANEAAVQKTITKDRTKYYRPYNREDYDPTNVNDDHGVAWRKDYSVDSSGDMYADSLTTQNGVDPDLHQTVEEGISVGGLGRYTQLVFESSQGRCELRSATVQAVPGRRRNGTIA